MRAVQGEPGSLGTGLFSLTRGLKIPYHLAHMNFLSPLWNLSFWFDLTPIRMAAGFEAAFFAFFALVIVAGSVIRMMIRNGKYDRYQTIVLKKIATLCSLSGVIGLVWFFLTFEEIQFFGSRFWFLIWIVGVLAGIVSIVRYVKKEVPTLQHREQSRADVNKYLPKRSR